MQFILKISQKISQKNHNRMGHYHNLALNFKPKFFMAQHYKKPHPGVLRVSLARFKEFLTSSSHAASFILPVLLALCSLVSNAQVTSNYSFAVNNGVNLIDISNGSTQLVASSVDDLPSGVFNIGFDFVFMGIPYTQFSASPDGFIRLGSVPAISQFTNATTSTTNLPKISPYWDDLATGVGGSVRYNILGTAPNRRCVIEWFVTVPRLISGNANSVFQLVLNETSNSMEFIYGGLPTNSGGYTIGFTNSATSFASVIATNNTVSFTTATDNNTVAIAPGLSYSFTPNNIVIGGIGDVTFTNVTATGFTLNFVDNATNETGFTFQRATNASFTEDVAWLTAVSPSTASSGTTLSIAQTGLTPGTTFFYRVFATVEYTPPIKM